MEKHYTLSKAAELLGVTTQTLRNWDNAGKIHTIRTPGNQRRIPESEIVRLLAPIAHKPQRTTIEIQAKSNHLLMCKDIAVYDITEALILDESLLPGCMLKNKMDFSQWMKTRYSKETNFSSQRLMQRAFGKFGHEHAVYATGAFSLSDCYWIKRQDEDTRFMDVTPYIHKEWDGAETLGGKNNYIRGSLSNLFVGGTTDKRWLDAQTLLKINSYNESEPYLLCAALGLDNIAEAHGTDEGLIISNFTSPDIFYESMEQFGIADEGADPRDLAVEHFKELAVALFVVDYLIENKDRNPDDYGFLRSSNTGEYISMAPYYNFDRVWSGDSVDLPILARQRYRGYIHSLCRWAISVASDFSYGTIIEKRAAELLR